MGGGERRRRGRKQYKFSPLSFQVNNSQIIFFALISLRATELIFF
jgi:hypothetical protein